MAAHGLEAMDGKGAIAFEAVRFRTEISVCFAPLMSKFLAGRRRDSAGAA